MTDDEFKAEVLRRFDGIDTRFDAIDIRMGHLEQRLDHVDGRLDAIVSRLDEQDAAHDRLLEKVDRMSHAVRDSLDASEQALSSITSLSRRIHRLERPDN